jgi:hypothetical protein
VDPASLVSSLYLPYYTGTEKRGRDVSVCSSSSRISKELEDEEIFLSSRCKIASGEETGGSNNHRFSNTLSKAIAKDKLKKD